VYKVLRWPDGWRAARKRIEGLTYELVAQYRDQIRWVALALLQHRKLDGAAIDDMVEHKRTNQKFIVRD
jgi:hypothetical protein